jgi:hypothetical protein
MSEQAGTSFRDALGRAGLLAHDDLHLALFRDLAGLSWPDAVKDAFAKCAEVGAVLLVVDTLPACAGVRGDEENSSGKALEVLEPLQVGADTHKVGVLISFHDRKSGGDVGESGRGSSAYAGGVDIILQLSKPAGNYDPTIRKIEALSRFDATPSTLFVQLTPEGYVSLGSEDDVVSAALARALIEVLPDTEDAAKRVDTASDKETEEILERGLIDDLAGQSIKVSRFTLDAELRRWIKNGYAGQSGAGKRGSPHRYWLLAKPPDAFFRSKESGAEERNGADRDGTAADASKVSSDAHTPSEERNAASSDDGGGNAMLSSDADSYSGRMNTHDSIAGTMESTV